MSKRVKCAECENAMFFATPLKVGADNYEYAKHCLSVAKRNLVCGVSDKTKPIDNEQYCKYFLKRAYEYSNKEDIKRLEDAIAEYERQLTNV